jgi:hypothetical protein
MKIKTIKKVISKKMSAWLDTLPIDLAEEVKPNILVSGGCITSMLLREDVNDFDVYIQDIYVLDRLAKHYAEPDNRVLKGEYKEIYMIENLRDRGIMCTLEEHLEKGVFHDGARVPDKSEVFLRYKNLKLNQIKLDISAAGKELEYLEPLKENEFKPLFFSQNAISLSDKLQIVLRFSGSVEEIHSTFDFYHATNYFTFDEGLVTNISALESTLTKELKYQGSLYPLTSIIRMKKFINRGWTMNAGEVLKMIFQCSELNLKDPEVLEEQLVGVDVAYFAILINLLNSQHTSQPITYDFLSSMIDKVFDAVEEEI